MSSIRALPLNCSLATLKYNYVHDYDTCRPRCANTWASARNVLDTFTRSPVALSPPAHLKPTLRLTCPTCVSLLACVEASPLSPAYAAHLGPLPCITPYRVDGASLSHSPQLEYSHSSIATPLRDIQTCVCMRISRVSCAWAE